MTQSEMQDPMAQPEPDTGAELLQEAQPRKRLSKRKLYTRRFFRNRPAVVGLVLFVLICLFAAFGNLFAKWGYVNDPDFSALSVGPSAGHWFGTDQGGADLYAQTVHGLQRSLMIAVIVSVVSVVISALVGASAAYFGGWYEWFWLNVIHFLLVVPTFLLLALLSNSSGGNWLVIAAILALTSWFLDARTIWTLSLSLRERDYVTAARYMGVPGFRIVTRHIIPHISSLLVLNLSLGVVLTVQTETALSFLGFGVKAPDVSLGSLIGTGSDTVSSSPWLFYFPAGALTLLTVSMALISDGLRDAFDPSSAAGGSA